ncbi:hypothetical protein GCM10009760_42970 [Kitasatospora kazusensis]|uniref:Uncharacterized protein n=1 Tax=Kitasatospora kazusensis TaxID=407974 RepID=A0ABN2ZXH6_9ACTN
MANDQSTTAVPAPAEPQTPVTATVTATETQPAAVAPVEHVVTTPDVLPDLRGLTGGTLIDEPEVTGPAAPTGLIVSRP